MPLWDIHTSGPLFNPEEKQELAKKITQIYALLPAFYVRVRFTEHALGATFSGGEADTKFVHLQIWHLARHFQSTEQKQGFLKRMDAVVTPTMEGKGLEWEYTVNESPRDLWKMNGMVPPEANSEMEKEWKRVNRPMAVKEKL